MATSSQLAYTSYVLGALTAGGGIMGYVKARSLPSVLAGCSIGLLWGIGGYRIQSRQPYSVGLSLLTSLVLAGMSIPNAIRTGKPVPTVLSLLSAVGMIAFGNAFRQSL